MVVVVDGGEVGGGSWPADGGAPKRRRWEKVSAVKAKRTGTKGDARLSRARDS